MQAVNAYPNYTAARYANANSFSQAAQQRPAQRPYTQPQVPASAPSQTGGSTVGSILKWGAIGTAVAAAVAGLAAWFVLPKVFDGVRTTAAKLVTDPLGTVKDLVAYPVQLVTGLLSSK